MKLAMLARNAGLYSHKRIVTAAKARGHDIDVIDTLRCYMNIAAHRPEVRYRGRSLQAHVPTALAKRATFPHGLVQRLNLRKIEARIGGIFACPGKTPADGHRHLDSIQLLVQQVHHQVLAGVTRKF